MKSKFIFGFLIYIFAIFIFKEFYLQLIEQSLPFREIYSPTPLSIFIYLIPFLIGLGLSYKRELNLSKIISLALLFSIPQLIFILQEINFLQIITPL